MVYKPTAETAVHALDTTQQLAAQKQYSWLSGLDVTLTGSTSAIETAVSSGTVVFDGETIDVAGGTYTHPAGDTTNPRWDALCVTAADGTIEVYTGVPAELVDDPQGNPIRGEAAFSPAPSDNITTEIVCIALVWIPSGATNNDDLTNQNTGGVANPIVDRRVYQAGQVTQTTRKATITTSGWHTIASQAPLGTGPATTQRLASALFTFRDTQAGRTSSTTFWASHMDAEQPTITVLSSSAGSASALDGIRIVSGQDDATNGAEVQVNVQVGTESQVSVEYTIQNNYMESGWWPESWQEGLKPTGYDSTDIYWRGEPRHIFASSNDWSSTARFSVDRDGNIAGNDLNRDTVGVRGYLSSNTTLSTNTYHNIVFDAVKFSNMPGFDTSTGIFTAPSDGYYDCRATMTWSSPNSGKRFVSYIGHNGTAAREHTHSAQAAPLSITVNDVVGANAGDDIRFAVQQYSGADQVLSGATNDTYFSIMKFG